ncbi:MATE family efflux transporter [Bacteroides sp. AN502(2024)]|uniref:MATE family efflux transporter n=1 Tax=Bacteroides sp. AN502(2024) TaxID=3160599 RepID=UPI003510F8D3
MNNNSSKSKRIAKNTLILYVRMFFLMLVSLYTSRIVLNTLGVEDFGIYNVVGGVVAMFSMLSGSLSAAITRFFTYELGRGNQERLHLIFSSSLTIQLGFALIIVILAETVGLWFLNVKMNIPDARMVASNWVFQFSILTFIINFICLPYNASIIAHERISAFAYISILEAVGKLAIAFLITIAPVDKLVFYALLMCIVALIVRFAYGRYCKRHFSECIFRPVFDKSTLRQMTGFAGWNLIGAASVVLRDQGGNIVINLFCGPLVNAARGVAFQVNTAVQSFMTNFLTALNPQITKSYASGDHKYMMTLIFQGARLSFYMLLLVSLPVLVNTHYILNLWLNTVPEHAVLFVQLVLIFSLCESISQPLITAMLATGNIRNYLRLVGGLQMMNLPVSYLLLRVGMFPEIVIVVAILISQCCLVAHLLMLRRMIGLPVGEYLRKVYMNVIIVAIISSLLPILVTRYLSESFYGFALLCFLSVACTAFATYFIGCNSNERQFVIDKIRILVLNISKQ